MRSTIELWVRFLQDADDAWGLPLVAVGLVLMFVGWQFHQWAIPLCYLLIGLLTGALLIEPRLLALWAGVLLGGVLALISRLQIKLTVALLGGLSGAFVFSGYLCTFKSTQSPLILGAAALLGFVAGTALAFVLYREMGMVVTSFIGALLLVSGVSSLMPEATPTLHTTIASFLNDYPAFFVPFIIGGPTLIGTLYQIAGKNRQDVGAI